jgi:predicted kinase
VTNLIILAGIPGCGKSTWARQFFDLKYKIVSTDEIRKRSFGSLKAAHADEGDRKQINNLHVFDAFHREIREALEHGVDVIADATNLTKSARTILLNIAEATGAQAHLVLFKNLFEATTRNAARDEDAQVPADVMDHMVGKYWNTLAEIVQESYASVTKIERLQ